MNPITTRMVYQPIWYRLCEDGYPNTWVRATILWYYNADRFRIRLNEIDSERDALAHECFSRDPEKYGRDRPDYQTTPQEA